MRNQLIQHLFNPRSLVVRPGGFAFSLKNRVGDFHIEKFLELRVDGKLLPSDCILVGGEPASDCSPEQPLPLALGASLEVEVRSEGLSAGIHRLDLRICLNPYGDINLTVREAVREDEPDETIVPRREAEQDYEPEIISARQEFLRQRTGAEFPHIAGYNFPARRAQGNVEQFIGAAQVPMGLGGPILIQG